jgi:hypothetical protein
VTPEASVALDLFLRWLNTSASLSAGASASPGAVESARHFQLETSTETGATATDGGVRLAAEVRPLLGPTENERWAAERERLEWALSEAVPARLALWAPGGAALPSGEPDTSEFLSLVREAALRLGPQERSYVPLPVSLYLRKNAGSGGVVSVTGALNPYWARFTDRVRGTYDLDSTRLHRLPESEEHLERLIETIVERASGLEPGQAAEIETIDAWTVQRLPGERGAAIIGVPPEEHQDAGLTVRRNLRRIFAETAPELRQQEAELRALVVIGYYPRIEQEGATTAMRGYDPALYSGIDFVCLVADGLVKPLIAAPAAEFTRRVGR